MGKHVQACVDAFYITGAFYVLHFSYHLTTVLGLHRPIHFLAFTKCSHVISYAIKCNQDFAGLSCSAGH